jgi:hypothetical protein
MIPRRHTVRATFTRPSDTNAYAATDAVSNSTSAPSMMTFTGVAPLHSWGAICRGAKLFKTTATTTNAAFDLILYRVSPVAFEDNAAWDPSDTEYLNEVGVVEFLSTDAVASSTNVRWHKTNLDWGVVSSTANSLFGVLVATAAYSPGSAEVFTVDLDFEQA